MSEVDRASLYAGGGDEVYPLYRRKHGDPRVVESKPDDRRPWVFAAQCKSARDAELWILQKVKTEGGSWMVEPYTEGEDHG